MIYCVLFQDDDRNANMRQKQMQAHLEFLHAHASHISAAGPLVDAATKAPAGGLWLVAADDDATVWSL